MAPRDGSGVYTTPVGTTAVPDTTIESAKYNVNVADVAQDLNLPRPVIAGGTGASTADNALNQLSAEKAKQVIVNWDAANWVPGSFYAATTATGLAPVAGHAFSGIVYTNNSTGDFTVEATDLTDPANPLKYTRMMRTGAWSAWITIGAGLISSQAVRYDAAQTLTTVQKAQARTNIAAGLRGWITALTLSTAGSSATFAVAIGEAADSTAVDLMALASAYTKTTAAWAVGSGNGALDTGAIAISAWYHVHLIKRPDTGVVDVLVSLSPTAPALPANYTLFRRIGSMRTNASSQWTKFIQAGNKFLWDPIITDINAAALSPGLVGLLGLSVPLGISVTVQFYSTIINPAAIVNVAFASPLITTLAGVNNPVGNISLITGGANMNASGQFSIETNTSSQIQLGSSATGTIYVVTQGWIDSRGRDS